MKCPHCLVAIHRGTTASTIIDFGDQEVVGTTRFIWGTEHQFCPECKSLIIWLTFTKRFISSASAVVRQLEKKEWLVVPEKVVQKPPHSLVEKQYADDYIEARLVLNDSPKASAALSRRCLQSLIRNKAGITKENLYAEIEELIKSGTLPSFISDQLHQVRVIGNIAAHSMKSERTGEIIDVEPGEAEWNLETLDSLFDFYFVQPEIAKKKKEEINKKLAEAGEKPIK